MEDVHNGLLCCVWEGNLFVSLHIINTHPRQTHIYVQCYTHAAPLLITTGTYPLSLKGRLLAAHFKCSYFPYMRAARRQHIRKLCHVRNL